MTSNWFQCPHLDVMSLMWCVEVKCLVHYSISQTASLFNMIQYDAVDIQNVHFVFQMRHIILFKFTHFFFSNNYRYLPILY